jgi:RNA polymerase sigma-70 factor (ECF subfamily)
VATGTTSATLLERLRDLEDRAAWDRLLALYTPLIRGWLALRVPQPADVDDLAQQVFTVLLEKFPTFAHSGRPGAFRAWLRGICLNRLRMFWRTRPPAAGPEALPEDLPATDDLEAHWDREHDAQVLRRALELIEPEFRPATWRAFRLLALEGAAPEAAAAELGMTVNAVFIAKSRVLRRLRDEVAGFVSEDVSP